jgi:hypothetical protein
MDKLQRVGRDFLMRLVAQHGLQGAARMLRALAAQKTICRPTTNSGGRERPARIKCGNSFLWPSSLVNVPVQPKVCIHPH